MSFRSSMGIVTLVLAAACWASPAPGMAQAAPTFDPSDARLVPSPVDNSDPGTLWTCRLAGAEVRCEGVFSVTWGQSGGPDDWCSVPLVSVMGTFTRTQTRYYGYDPSTGDYLEHQRLIHLDSDEHLTTQPGSPTFVTARLHMTWKSTFQTAGDLDTRITRKQGIDTLIKLPDGGIVVLDAGQKTEDLTVAPGEDFDFRGRWDIALGDPAVELGKVCSALGL